MSGLLQDMLRKPTFKEIMRGHFNNITTGGGRELVKVIMWQDLEFFFGVLGTIPAVVNNLAGGTAQLVSEIRAKFGPRLFKEFVGSILSGVDPAEFRSLVDEVSALARDVIGASPELKTFLAEQGPVYVAKGINAGTEGINAVCRQNPDLIAAFLKQVIDNLDKPALNDAVLNLADAFLDQNLGLLSLVGGLIRRRSAKLVRRFRPAA